MNTYAEKTQANKRHSLPNFLAQRKSSRASHFQFVDHRPKARSLKTVQTIASQSPQALQLRAAQNMVTSSPYPIQAAQLRAMTGSRAAYPIQKQPIEEEDELQLQAAPIQQKASPEFNRGENNTGLPDSLKSGIETLSGVSLDDVNVHYNSPKPAQLNALAYAQGSDIHIGADQEKHLPHEAWHITQQKQGRVKPTMQLQDVAINDADDLEREADRMGARALGGV